MIQVNGTIRIEARDVGTARAALVTMMEKSRAEDGCLDYTFAQDLSDPAIIVLYERWRDRAALDAHAQSTHMRDFQQTMAANPPVSRNIRLYETDEGRPL